MHKHETPCGRRVREETVVASWDSMADAHGPSQTPVTTAVSWTRVPLPVRLSVTGSPHACPPDQYRRHGRDTHTDCRLLIFPAPDPGPLLVVDDGEQLFSLLLTVRQRAQIRMCRHYVLMRLICPALTIGSSSRRRFSRGSGAARTRSCARSIFLSSRTFS